MKYIKFVQIKLCDFTVASTMTQTLRIHNSILIFFTSSFPATLSARKTYITYIQRTWLLQAVCLPSAQLRPDEALVPSSVSEAFSHRNETPGESRWCSRKHFSIKKGKILTVELEKFPTWLRIEFYLRICREVGCRKKQKL